MNKRELYSHPGWRWCTFEGAREQVLLLGLKTTFREKLEWLEEIETLTLTMRASQVITPAPPDTPPSASVARQP